MPGDDDHKAGRISAGNRLVQNAKAISKVKEDAWVDLMHDQLMYQIEDAVRERRGNSKAPFTDTQLLILKDVAFKVMFLMAHGRPQPAGFFRRSWAEWSEKSPLNKVIA